MREILLRHVQFFAFQALNWYASVARDFVHMTGLQARNLLAFDWRKLQLPSCTVSIPFKKDAVGVLLKKPLLHADQVQQPLRACETAVCKEVFSSVIYYTCRGLISSPTAPEQVPSLSLVTWHSSAPVHNRMRS